MALLKFEKKTYKFLSIFITLIFSATIISAFKYFHYAIGSFFLARILYSTYQSYHKNKQEKAVFWLSTFGMAFTLVCGTIVEIWGTSYGYWTYLNLPANIDIPFWVPFAWGLSYKAIYRLEFALLNYFKFESLLKKWIYCVALPAVVLPVIGEAFVIYFETWVYAWQPQFMGVPLLAVFLLMVFHVSIFIIMCKICKFYAINDPVYSKFI